MIGIQFLMGDKGNYGSIVNFQLEESKVDLKGIWYKFSGQACFVSATLTVQVQGVESLGQLYGWSLDVL